MNLIMAHAIMQLDLIATREQFSKQFKKLSKSFHPDLNKNQTEADKDKYKLIVSAYEFVKKLEDQAWDRLKKEREQENARDEGHYDRAYKHDYTEDNAPFKIIDILRTEIEKLQGVNFELQGLWIWLSGNTKEHKENIKSLGFSWSKSRSAWYFVIGQSNNCNMRSKYYYAYKKEKAKNERYKRENKTNNTSNTYDNVVSLDNNYTKPAKQKDPFSFNINVS